MRRISSGTRVNRRAFPGHGGLSAGILAFGAGTLFQGCESQLTLPEPKARPTLRIPRNIDAAGALVEAGAAELDLGSHVSRARGYNGTVPGPTIRARVGQRLQIRVLNQLSEDTTVRWHGLVVQGWKDTVLLENGERVEVAIRFDAYAGVYLLHCHKLEHEDAGMMLNFEVM